MRRHVISADGTWKSEKDTSDATNVEKLHAAVAPRDSNGVEQRAVYGRGVGTGSVLDKLVGGAFGKGLSRHVQQCYRELVRHYADGDELFLFGFSRGAYTVRSLAGLIRNMGILRPEHEDLIGEAYSHYRDRDEDWAPDTGRSKAFREQYSWPLPRITFLGVWDTVGSLGVPTRGPLGLYTRRRYGFHDVELSGIVAHACQALAIDERRTSFAPTLWHVDKAHAGRQQVQQAWFAGAHSNVGGGCLDCGLSDTTLLWMAEQAEACGLALDPGTLATAVATYDGTLSDSYRGLFRLVRPYSRPINARVESAKGTDFLTYETVHPSARERNEKCLEAPTGPYQPKNLLAYLESMRAQLPGGGVPGDAG